MHHVEAIKETKEAEGNEEGEVAEGGVKQEKKAKTPDGRIDNYSDESDIDQELIDQIPEGEIETIMKEMFEMEFNNDEEVMAHFKERLGKQKKNRDPRKPDTRAKKDPYYAAMKNDAETITPLSDPGGGGEMLTTYKDFCTLQDMREKTIGRYPIGYRHYENYTNYRI